METYLAHHGILGQKWGIRRFQNKDGTLTTAGNARYNKQAKKRRRNNTVAKKKLTKAEMDRELSKDVNKPRPVQELSDEEIDRFLARREKEQKYLSAITPKTVEKEKSTVDRMMSTFGSTLVDSIAKGAAKRVSDMILDSVFPKQDKDKNKKKKDDDD